MGKQPEAQAKPGSAVAVAEENKSLAVAGEFDYTGYENSGFDQQTADDYSIPFFEILQAQSPAIEKLDAAKAGMTINTVSNELFKDGIFFVPVDTKHCVVEWRPRESGGGIVDTHELNHDLVVHAKETQEFGKWKTPSGNDLVETFYVYGIRTNAAQDEAEQGVIAFTSTKIKKYKGWMATANGVMINVKDAQGRLVRRVKPPLFAHVFKLTTVKEKNNKGEFWNWDVKWASGDAAASRLPTKGDLFQSAAALFEMVRAGNAKLNTNSVAGTAGTDAGDSGGASARGGADGEEPPF